LDSSASNAILPCPLIYPFFNTKPAVAASIHLYGLG
jgi:hypothetical protein